MTNLIKKMGRIALPFCLLLSMTSPADAFTIKTLKKLDAKYQNFIDRKIGDRLFSKTSMKTQRKELKRGQKFATGYANIMPLIHGELFLGRNFNPRRKACFVVKRPIKGGKIARVFQTLRIQTFNNIRCSYRDMFYIYDEEITTFDRTRDIKDQLQAYYALIFNNISDEDRALLTDLLFEGKGENFNLADYLNFDVGFDENGDRKVSIKYRALPTDEFKTKEVVVDSYNNVFESYRRFHHGLSDVLGKRLASSMKEKLKQYIDQTEVIRSMLKALGGRTYKIVGSGQYVTTVNKSVHSMIDEIIYLYPYHLVNKKPISSSFTDEEQGAYDKLRYLLGKKFDSEDFRTLFYDLHNSNMDGSLCGKTGDRNKVTNRDFQTLDEHYEGMFKQKQADLEGDKSFDEASELVLNKLKSDLESLN